ncbi:MAG: hypothetical protein Q8934_16050 [Bacillota bacterium]|nr:hypothetical protein [Bacillota bacterium]
MSYPFLRDFYQKALIPIGLNDLALLNESDKEKYDLPPLTTHWMIVLVGELVSETKEYYHWRVNIYPSDCEGTFSWPEAIYSSELIVSFDWAFELARKFESITMNDQLLSSNLQLKIS